MPQFIPQTPPLFQTQLAAPYNPSTDNTFTLASPLMLNGVALSGLVCASIDIGQPNPQYDIGTLAGTLFTVVLKNVDPLNPTIPGTVPSTTHRRGATVKITDFASIQIMKRLLSGEQGFQNKLKYDAVQTFTADEELVDKAYVDGQLSSNQVLVSGTDTTPGFLSDKIVPGTGVTFNILNPGADEQLEVNFSGGGGTGAGGGGAVFTKPKGDAFSIAFGLTDIIDTVGPTGASPARGNLIPSSGTINSLIVDVSGNTLNGVLTAELLVNGVATGITITALAGVDNLYSDNLHTFDVVSGDRVSLRLNSTAAASGVASVAFSFQFGAVNGLTINATAAEDVTLGEFVGISNLVDDSVATANQTSILQAFGASPGAMKVIQIATDKIAILYTSGANLVARVGTINRASMTFTFGAAVNVNTNTPTHYDIHKLDTNKFAVVYNTAANTSQIRLVGATVATNTITLGSSVLLYTSPTGPQALLRTIQLGTDRGVMMCPDDLTTANTVAVIAYTFSGTVPTAGAAVVLNLDQGGSGPGSQFVMAKIATDKFAVSAWNRAIVCTVAVNTITGGTPVDFTGSGASGAIRAFMMISPTDNVFVVGVIESNNPFLWCATVSGTVPTFGAHFSPGAEYQHFVLSATKLLQNGNTVINIAGTVLSDGGQIYNYTLVGTLVDMHDGTFWSVTFNGSNLQYFIRGMSQGFLGIAQAAASLGNTVRILIKGLDANQSGLIAGNRYTWNGTALIIDNAGPILALSATEVII